MTLCEFLLVVKNQIVTFISGSNLSRHHKACFKIAAVKTGMTSECKIMRPKPLKEQRNPIFAK